MNTGIAQIFGNVQEPRIRLNKVTPDSKMGINFNNNMVLPSNFKDVVEKDRLRYLNEGDEQPLILLESASGLDSDPALLGLVWELVDAVGSGFQFKLKYMNPLEVSQNDEPDKIKVILNIDQITDEYGQSLPNGTSMIVDAPRQIPSEEEAVALEQSGESSETASLSVMGGNLVVNFLLAAALNHLWSMLNGLQLSTHL